ncbi:hypothetical protein XELAEV_18033045mg [Xenopus laevis]|uniref:Uncharacterized protein n=1 Tax=Xenopus laevis TaxID=8355 RepID=A0A974CIM5_XENLA|nr:hypothetical protein XELAEV_18033045mg [Xenopus laevis]
MIPNQWLRSNMLDVAPIGPHYGVCASIAPFTYNMHLFLALCKACSALCPLLAHLMQSVEVSYFLCLINDKAVKVAQICAPYKFVHD